MTITGLDQVTVQYAGRTVLDQVSLTVEPGEILAVLGPSGSGKSTLLRALAGLVPVSSGEVLLNGQVVTHRPADQRRVAMVFESSTAIPFLDVAQNLGWGLRVRQVPADEADHKVRGQARSLGLSRLLRRMPRTLSNGELSRVGIGHALVHTPTAFLFDEPLAGLDANQRLAVRRKIVEVVRGHQVATIYVTHDQQEAMSIGDRIALLNSGAVVQVGTAQQLYAQPNSIFAASFIGSPAINLLPACPVQAGSDPTGGFRVGARTLPFWGPLPPEVAALVGREVVLGIRPEHVSDARTGIDPNTVTLPATVVHLEHTGPDVVVTLEVAVAATKASGTDRAQVRARFDRHTTVRPGDSVLIAVDVRQVHVFDPHTGRAVQHPPIDPPEAPGDSRKL